MDTRPAEFTGSSGYPGREEELKNSLGLSGDLGSNPTSSYSCPASYHLSLLLAHLSIRSKLSPLGMLTTASGTQA